MKRTIIKFIQSCVISWRVNDVWFSMIRKSGYVWRAFGKVNLRLVELVGVGSETFYYWFNWSSAKRLDPQRISFLSFFLIFFNCNFLFLFNDLWFVFIRNNAIIFFIESVYLKIFFIITLYHLIHMHTFTMIFLHTMCCSSIDAKFKRSYYQVYIYWIYRFHTFQWRYHFVRYYGCDETLII